MAIERPAEMADQMPGIVELDGSPPSKNLLTRLTEAVINGREPIPAIPFSELIPELKRIADGGGTLEEYIDQLEQKEKVQKHENGRVTNALEIIKRLAHPDKQIVIDGHPVGGKTTAIVAVAGTLVVGAGIFLRLGHKPLRPVAKKGQKEKPAEL